ncbi:RNA polymerase sigma factor [Rhodopirellula sp. JC639]|uniref:RNA polymerase sigma factor n=1 Tax=Stieleria mannarensis TaxID=2755585 RepID=UPI00336A15CA
MSSSQGQTTEDQTTENSSIHVEDCVRRAIKGDGPAFQEIYKLCSPRVYGLMTRMVGRQNADDLTQQVFMQVFRKLEQFSGDSKLETWIYRLAVNEALQYLRREKRRKAHPLDFEPEDGSTSRVETSELVERLRKAIKQLDPELCAVITLKEDAGLSYREIAEAVGIPEGTVGSRLNRARAELRKLLE